ncbi:MAG: porin [Muribaculaceae bacterium]|nr:porin [Muribaculaceae bacterium]
MKRLLLLSLLLLLALPPMARAEKSIYIPTVYGTVRARYEYLTRQNRGGFKVRDLRFGVNGYVAPIVSYCGEVDFSDWGRMALVNAYVRVLPLKGLNFTLGQQRIPFTIAAHRQPCEQFFVNRTFLAKHGGFRDIGLTGSYDIPKIPLTVQAGVYNCSGVGEHRLYFTNSYGFSAKLISAFLPQWYASASTARIKRGIAWEQMWDIGAYFHNGLWHVEGEYLRKNYMHELFQPVNAFDFFVYRLFPIEKKMIGGVSGAARYDYMGNHSSGVAAEDGKLTIDNPECHRLTLGATLSLKSKLQADFRINYEKYFFRKGVTPSLTDDDRIVVEVIAHF